MKFPEAKEYHKEDGWRIDLTFLDQIHEKLQRLMCTKDIEAVLLAAQQVMEQEVKSGEDNPFGLSK